MSQSRPCVRFHRSLVGAAVCGMTEGDDPPLDWTDVTSDRTTPYTSTSDRCADRLPTDICQTFPDLTEVIESWPVLPAPLRAGIMAMVRAAAFPCEPGSIPDENLWRVRHK
jgi:hypothetical protein